MIEQNTNLDYPLLTILSTGKKSCQNMGTTIGKDGRAVAKLRNEAEDNFEMLSALAINAFKHKKIIKISIDDTLIDKFYAEEMVGAGLHFDTKIGRKLWHINFLLCLQLMVKFLYL